MPSHMRVCINLQPLDNMWKTHQLGEVHTFICKDGVQYKRSHQFGPESGVSLQNVQQSALTPSDGCRRV